MLDLILILLYRLGFGIVKII